MASEDLIEPNENIIDLTIGNGTSDGDETAEEDTAEEGTAEQETAEDESARRLQAIRNQTPAGYSPRRGLRQVLSLPEVQDRAFGIDSPGGLTRDDYDNLATIIGPVLDEQGKGTETLERIFPEDCDELLSDDSGDEFACPRKEGLRRCVGYYADPGHVAGQPNPNFNGLMQGGGIQHDYIGRIQHHYIGRLQDVLKVRAALRSVPSGINHTMGPTRTTLEEPAVAYIQETRKVPKTIYRPK
ncbi:MAG: hypothetical protein LQ346_003484 [Caloplaca aetnensis]|nr:MAG: hypothetical protein LQ346_003484 [Caloplaca aetnensis]